EVLKSLDYGVGIRALNTDRAATIPIWPHILNLQYPSATPQERTMRQPYESYSEACMHGFSTSHSYSVTWGESTAGTEGTCDSADNSIGGQQAVIDAD